MPDVSPGGLALESFGAGIRVGRVWRGERGFLDRLAPDSPPARPSLALTPGPVPPPVRSVSYRRLTGGASPDEAGPQAGGLGLAEKVGGDGSQAVDKGSGIAILSDPRQNRSVVLRGDMPVSAASAPDPQVS